MYTGKQFGSYRLLRLLGKGGFAHVYLGEHMHLKTPAAIKILTTALSENEIDQFRHEARLMIQMDHPHIVRVLDFGLQGPVPFLVMSYAPGGTLRHRHAKGKQLSLPTVVEYVNQIASALQYIHDRQLIHRDVKPENMLITQGDTIALSDFGIVVMAHSERSLRQQDIGGTGLYMAPESFEGKSRTASDQYALAIVAYEWLTGAPPFRGSLTQLAYQHAYTPPPSLCEQVAVSRSLESVILKALAKDPLARFSTVQEFAHALEEAGRPANTFPTPQVPVHHRHPPSHRSAPQGSVASAPLAIQQSLPSTKLAPPVSRDSDVPLARDRPFGAVLPMPKGRKRWFLPLVCIMGIFLLLGGTIFGVGAIFSAVFLQTPGPPSGEAPPTVAAFLHDVTQQNYHQAYRDLDPSLLLVMTESDFAKRAQADDRCSGPIIRYVEVISAQQRHHGTQNVAYTLTRGKLSRSYTLNFLLSYDVGSDRWLIAQYGAHDDLGPASSLC